MAAQQFVERLHGQQRRVAAHDEQRAAEVAQRRLGHHARVAGAALLGLHGPFEIAAVRERRAHLLALVADHDDLAADAEPVERVEHVAEQRPAGHRVKHLREIAVHALAHAGGEHQRGDVGV